MDDQDVPATRYDAALLRRLLRYLRPYRWLAAGAVLLLLVQSGLALIGPRLTERALDVAIPRMDLGLLGLLAGLYLATLLFELVVEYGGALLTAFVGQRVMYDLRMEIFGHLQRLSVTYFDRNPVGRLMTRVTSDVETLNELFSSGVVTIFGDVFTLVAIMGMMLVIDVKLALVTFAVIPLVWLTAAIFRRRVRDAFRDIRYRLARLNAFLQERLSGMRVVQLFGREADSARRFGELNREHLGAHLRSITIYAIFFPVVEVLTAVAMALLLWYGGLRVLDETLTVGVLAAFIQYTRRFFQPLQDLSEKFNLLQSAMASSERVFALLDEPVTVREPASPAALPRPVRGEVRFEGVWFRYSPDGPWVLKDISFTASPGRTLALVGHTGAGKTTIVNLLLRFYDPERGRITVDGVDIRDLSTADLRSAIGFVQQDLFLFTGDILHNLTLGAPISREAARLAAERVGADRFIERLPSGYEHRLGERGRNLSVGRAPAAELRPGAGARPPDPGAGRGHQLGGRGGGGADPAGDRRADGRPHQPGGGAPAQHHSPCRRDPGAAPRGDPGAGHPPGAAGGRRALRAPLPAAASRAGGPQDCLRSILLACPRSPGYVWHPVKPSGSDR